MQIIIKRLKSSRLYTEGQLFINDKRNTLTIESTELMLPAGQYILQLVNKSARKRELTICQSDGTKTGWNIGTNDSWIGSKKDHTICIGQYLIPGALYHAAPIFERIIKRLEKCKDRKEPILLFINDDDCTHVPPIGHWLEHSNHGCTPSKRHVEADEEGNCTIYDGDQQIAYITIEQLMRSKKSRKQSHSSSVTRNQ